MCAWATCCWPLTAPRPSLSQSSRLRRVTFSDGTSLVTTTEHQWSATTADRWGRAVPTYRIMTSAEIRARPPVGPRLWIVPRACRWVPLADHLRHGPGLRRHEPAVRRLPGADAQRGRA